MKKSNVPPLSELIAHIQKHNGWSDRDVERMAREKNCTFLSKSNISRLKHSPLESIKASSIRGIAAVLGVTESLVAESALVSMGIKTRNLNDVSPEEALGRDPRLTIRDRLIIVSILRQMREEPSD